MAAVDRSQAPRRALPGVDAAHVGSSAGPGGRPLHRLQEQLVSTPGPLVALAIGAAYLALAQYAIWLNDPVNAGAGYWPANGITLVALLLLPTRRWGWVIGAVAAAEVGGDALHGYPLVASAWWAAGNVVEPVVATILLRRFGHGGRLAPMPDLVRFLGSAVVVAPLAGAAIGSIGTSSEYGVTQLDVLLKWWAGDGLGVLVVAPLLLCFRERPIPGRSWVEAAALAVSFAVVAPFAFRGWSSTWDVVLPYLIFPLVMWASVRFGIRGAAIVGFGVAELANLATALGYGPFLLVAGPDHAITVLQIFLGTALAAGLVIATLVNDALERTRLFERQRSVAEALQVAVLPDSLPAVPGLALAARYVPASSDAAIHVGGDWYDVFELPGGATALVVGDVAGHDLDAAVVMGHLRNGLRSLLRELEDPGAVMAALDRQLAATADGVLATAVIATYRDGELWWANAGHPPLLVASGASVRYLDDAADAMIGVGQGSYATHRTLLEAGDVLVGFTDGLVEHRGWSLDEAFTNLAALVEAAPSRAPGPLCDRLLEEGLGGRSRDDDACVLVVRRVV